MIKKNIRIEKKYSLIYLLDILIPLFFTFLLLVDSIDGYFLIHNIKFPIGIIYKAILMFLLFVRLCSVKEATFIIYTQFLFCVLLFFHHSFFKNGGEIAISLLIGSYFKFIGAVWTYLYFCDYVIKEKDKAINNITKILFINATIVIINIILGIFGIGYSSYGMEDNGSNVGYQGFFYAGNELSGVILILFSFILYYLAKQYSSHSKKYVLSATILMIVATLTATKAPIIAMILSLFFIPRIINIKSPKTWNYILKNIFKLLIILIFFIGIAYFIIDSSIGSRWEYAWNVVDGNVLAFLLSGRDSYLQEIIKNIHTLHFSEFVLGIVTKNLTVEMDPIDAFLNYGIIGFMGFYAFYLYLLLKNIWINKKCNNSDAKYAIYLNSLLLLISSVAGHILFSGMVNFFIGIINAFCLKNTLYNNKIK